jgi:hypothetical protein
MRLALLLLVVFQIPSFADGGALLMRQESGTVIISVFADPLPIRVGALDVSALVQDRATRAPLSDVAVRITMSRSDPANDSEAWQVVCNSLNGLGTDAVASQSHSTNKLLFSAWMGVPSPGAWELAVSVRRDGHTDAVTRRVDVLPPPAPLQAWWPLIALVPAAIAGYLLRALFLRQRGRIRSE